jgi:hypothetical protein
VIPLNFFGRGRDMTEWPLCDKLQNSVTFLYLLIMLNDVTLCTVMLSVKMCQDCRIVEPIQRTLIISYVFFLTPLTIGRLTTLLCLYNTLCIFKCVSIPKEHGFRKIIVLL